MWCTEAKAFTKETVAKSAPRAKLMLEAGSTSAAIPPAKHSYCEPENLRMNCFLGGRDQSEPSNFGS